MILSPVEYSSDVSRGIAIHKKFLIPSLQLGIFMLYLIHTIAVGIPGVFICVIRETLINSARADAEGELFSVSIDKRKDVRQLNVTTKGRYALRFMTDLALHPEDGFISLKTIADRQNVSMKYLEMIAGSLKKANLITSTRGKEGGYVLARLPSEYTIGEILRCTEENLAPVSCIRSGNITCDHAAECLTVPMWKELDDLTNSYLDSITLYDLLSGEKWK